MIRINKERKQNTPIQRISRGWQIWDRYLNIFQIYQSGENVLLLSNKKDNYIAIGPEKTGLYTNGNTKSLKIVKGEKPILIIANNNGDSEVFQINIEK